MCAWQLANYQKGDGVRLIRLCGIGRRRTVGRCCLLCPAVAPYYCWWWHLSSLRSFPLQCDYHSLGQLYLNRSCRLFVLVFWRVLVTWFVFDVSSEVRFNLFSRLRNMSASNHCVSHAAQYQQPHLSDDLMILQLSSLVITHNCEHQFVTGMLLEYC